MIDQSTTQVSPERTAYWLSEAHDTLLQVNDLLCMIRDAELEGEKTRINIFTLADVGIKITGRLAQDLEGFEIDHQKPCEETGGNHE